MKTSAECLKELQASTMMYYYAVGASLSLSFMVAIVYRFCLKKHMDGAPGLAAQFFFVTGSVKILLALCLFTIFRAKCPDQCSCNGDSLPGPVYAILALLVGLLWLRRGAEKLRQARLITEEGGIGDDNEAVFKAVSLIEVV
jgi:hypothetical protein